MPRTGNIKKGQILNPNGRPKGARNEKTKQWEALAHSITNEHTERFNNVLRDMDDIKFAEFYLKILNYFKPTLSSSNSYNVNADLNSIQLVINADNIPQFPDNVEDDNAGVQVLDSAAVGSSFIQDAEVIEEKERPDVETSGQPPLS